MVSDRVDPLCSSWKQAAHTCTSRLALPLRSSGTSTAQIRLQRLRIVLRSTLSRLYSRSEMCVKRDVEWSNRGS